jgi:hypothetical protein
MNEFLGAEPQPLLPRAWDPDLTVINGFKDDRILGVVSSRRYGFRRGSDGTVTSAEGEEG